MIDEPTPVAPLENPATESEAPAAAEGAAATTEEPSKPVEPPLRHHLFHKETLLNDEDDVLQAVILADSFNKRFRPLTTHKPRCLLPICNAPLLDWTFESLALAGVQEIFVICRSHAEQVKTAITDSKWSKPGSGIKIVPILTAKETFSPGDAMRDIYTRGLVTSDFVLVMGDLVSNIRIDEVVRVHKERRKTNKDAIMTMVVKESGIRHRTRTWGDSSVFVLDAETSECLHYEPIAAHPRTTIAHIPREVMEAHPEIEIRNDLIDCAIDVCSVEVPSLFQDNFDYLDIRRDFVHGVLTSDLLMKSIHCYVATDGYAARVKDTKSYESVSKDILSRWTFPLVPDDNHPGGQLYEHIRGNKYIAKDNTVVLARTCKVGNNTLIGSSTQVAENVNIIASVIGRNCVIGAGTIISHAYIFDGTTIDPQCIIDRSIVGANVHLKEGTRVSRGCLIGDGVIVGPRAVLEPFERLSKKREIEPGLTSAEGEDVDSDLEDVEAGWSPLVLLNDLIPKSLGEDSNAIVWPRGPPDEDEDEEGVESYKNQRFMRLGDEASDLESSDAGSASSDSEDESSDDEDSDFQINADTFSGLSGGSIPLNAPSMDGASSGLMADSEFRTEVAQSLERAFTEGHSVDNAAVELKTLRMASNVPLSRVREAVVSAIVEKIQIIEAGGILQRKEIATVVGRWGELINKIGGVDPVETISALQSHCAISQRMPLFGQILAALYQDDIVEEDHIRAWHALPASRGQDKSGTEAENAKKCWMVGAHMIQQFDEQESDEDESEEESEEGDKNQGAAPGRTAKHVDNDNEDNSESEEDDEPKGKVSDDDSESEEVEGPPAPAGKPATDSTNDDSDEDDSDEGEETRTAQVPADKVLGVKEPTITPTPGGAPANPLEEDDESDEDEDDEDDDVDAKP
ncbi:nucleotide-diphospho-sugar transferase [Infundibulicybe gibba]|nr:nucleotide-diphospho-sugar transferase [Infundibulicybe gibba]